MNLATAIDPNLWAAVRRSYESHAWSNAILDSVHHLSDIVRAKSGLQSDGTALAGQALGGKYPKIRLNKLSTESDKNVQAGVEQLVRGLYQAVRNPRSHEKFEDSQRECDALIIFVDYLLSVIEHAKAAFSIEGVLSRITDENFVANKRYAELILADVPRTKKLDTLIAAFERRDTSDSSNQKYFVQACLSTLETDEQQQFFDVVSLHLRSSTDEGELRSVFQILEPAQWPLVAEADRMRSENRVIRCIKAGRYSQVKQRCTAGGMATWARGFFKAFTLKREIVEALHSALNSSVREQQDYVFKFFFSYLDVLTEEKLPRYWVSHIQEQLERGDSRYKQALQDFEIFGVEAWIDPFRKQLQDFKPNDQAIAFEDFDDDIPF
jgi:uncharacterized protein (TIGR02391 family)